MYKDLNFTTKHVLRVLVTTWNLVPFLQNWIWPWRNFWLYSQTSTSGPRWTIRWFPPRKQTSPTMAPWSAGASSSRSCWLWCSSSPSRAVYSGTHGLTVDNPLNPRIKLQMLVRLSAGSREAPRTHRTTYADPPDLPLLFDRASETMFTWLRFRTRALTSSHLCGTRITGDCARKAILEFKGRI